MRIKDITGQKFGRLTVIKATEKRTKNKEIIWLCKCECGKEKETTSDRLKRGGTKSCGCLKSVQEYAEIKDITGHKFGRLTVIKATEKRTNKKEIIWLCECECGNEKEAVSVRLKNGKTKSCGCLNRELAREKMLRVNQDKDLLEKSIRIRVAAIKRDYTNERFGMLVAIRPTENKKYKNETIWEFKSDCGNHCFKAISQVRYEQQDCGCMTKEKFKENGLKAIVSLNAECEHDTNAKLLRTNKVRKDNTSGVRGVSKTPWGKWVAKITFQKKNYSLGTFENKDDAIKVRKQAEEMMFEPFLKWYEEQQKIKADK